MHAVSGSKYKSPENILGAVGVVKKAHLLEILRCNARQIKCVRSFD
jgi:hypothetical protein